jgi:hypothetical protein
LFFIRDGKDKASGGIVKAKVYQSQHQALRQVNKSLIGLYWEIGRSIVEKQEKHG